MGAHKYESDIQVPTTEWKLKRGWGSFGVAPQNGIFFDVDSPKWGSLSVQKCNFKPKFANLKNGKKQVIGCGVEWGKKVVIGIKGGLLTGAWYLSTYRGAPRDLTKLEHTHISTEKIHVHLSQNPPTYCCFSSQGDKNGFIFHISATRPYPNHTSYLSSPLGQTDLKVWVGQVVWAGDLY